MINRRSFLVTLMSALVAPAIVRASNIMPVRALMPDPLVEGVRWQSWPWELPCPTEFAKGSIGIELGNARPLRPLSSFMKRIDRYQELYPDLVWEAVSPVRGTFG